jgi:hypothetical protein
MRLPCPKIQYVLEVRESQGVRAPQYVDNNPHVGGRLAVPGVLVGRRG